MSIVYLSADPAYAAIRRYRAAMAVFNAYNGPEDEHHDELERAFFADVVPTTVDGFKTKVATFLACFDGVTKDGLESFLNTLCKSACIIAGQ
jgi:hypothetical protein